MMLVVYNLLFCRLISSPHTRSIQKPYLFVGVDFEIQYHSGDAGLIASHRSHMLDDLLSDDLHFLR